MGTILLLLYGYMQSWGDRSRFTERNTRHEPTKSGIVGLLSAALGRKRDEPIDDLAAFPMAVRVDQEGGFLNDYQTAAKTVSDETTREWRRTYRKIETMPVSHRYYLTDAMFVAGIEVQNDRIDELADALVHPSYPLYLGRRSCPPSTKILLDARPDVGLIQALSETPWQAITPSLMRKHQHDEHVELRLVRDATHDDQTALLETVRDIPLSFSKEHRLYTWRTVAHDKVIVPNPNYVPLTDADTDGADVTAIHHDPTAAISALDKAV